MQIYRKPAFGYSEAEWLDAVRNPAVIHFTTSFLSIRPWYAGSEHPYAKEWNRIHDTTPWKECGFRELPNRDSKAKKVKLYKTLPKWISIHVAGFLHAYVKPIIYVAKG